jgi:GAF domain-containing protein
MHTTPGLVPSTFCSLDELIVHPDASPPRGREAAQAESEALLALSAALRNEPALALQRLVELALNLTGAASSGLSLEETDDQGMFFRWIATAGEFARYLNGTMPRDFSPCGAAVDARKSLVMRDPARYYAYISQLHAPVCTAMLVPFARGGRMVGTVWVVQHERGKSFTGDDVRAVQNLATFAAAVLDTAQRRAGDRAPP